MKKSISGKPEIGAQRQLEGDAVEAELLSCSRYC
jgi:hypothetical protein